MWKVEREAYFIECIEEEEISEVVIDSIKRWATTSSITPTKKSRRVFISPNNIFQVWNIKLPDPDFNQGSSGGFRMVCYYLINEKSMKLVSIHRRRELGGNKKRKRQQQKFTDFNDRLIEDLMEVYENGN